MPKALDSKLIQAMERAYLDRKSKPSLNQIATEFGVGFSTVKKISSENNWKTRRDAAEVARAEGEIAGARAAVRKRPRVDELELLNDAIADLSGCIAGAEVRSKEAAANALTGLIKAKRELYPPDAAGLAEMAVQLGISPTDFMEALKQKWAGELQQPQNESMNGGKALPKN